jgi:hypothetical protein
VRQELQEPQDILEAQAQLVLRAIPETRERLGQQAQQATPVTLEPLEQLAEQGILEAQAQLVLRAIPVTPEPQALQEARDRPVPVEPQARQEPLANLVTQV